MGRDDGGLLTSLYGQENTLNTSKYRPDNLVWVFGYGSLIWKQDFPYLAARRAHIHGWSRRFWQGSHDHRGVADDPGRVVTLVSNPDAECAGMAFLVEAGVFTHLDHREKNGYQRIVVNIVFADDEVTGTTYVAAEDNPAFLGEATPRDMAKQINRCEGPSGSNREYVLKLARALRDMGAVDEHVFEVESLVRGWAA